ncbi:hypothetical protein ACTJKC_06510 [Pedobacter sp. 22226]|uniref:hypothetical protein n=1 Tax=Pedobacter sp. 22226 TaxID=3453894 RepID=UPI003F83445D
MIKISKIIFVFLVLSHIRSNAQFLPTANISEYRKENSVVYRNLKDKYDFILSYHVSGGWSADDTTTFQILALKNKTWKKIFLKSSLRTPSGTVKVTEVNFQKKKAKLLMNQLTKFGFWSLKNDSLNIKEIKPKIPAENFVKNDTVMVVADRIRRFSVVDGTTYHFEIIQKNRLTTYSCESPDTYLNVFPEIKSTSIFIKTIKAFENAIKNQ